MLRVKLIHEASLKYLAGDDHRGHRRHRFERILTNRVYHDNDSRPQSRCLTMAGILIPPVAPILVMDDRLNTQFVRNCDGTLLKYNIYENNVINIS
jgi:hypothetical protein